MEIVLQSVLDKVKGNLFVGEVQKQIPFPIKRFYVIRDVPSSEIDRGMHAHKNLEQVLFCLNGSFELGLDDGQKKWEVFMDDPSKGEFIGKGIWRSMSNFSKDCVLLVVASEHYNESDYIRDYDAFLKYISNQ